MSYHLPFRGLPRKLRDQIYEVLLRPPEGVAFKEPCSEGLEEDPSEYRVVPKDSKTRATPKKLIETNIFRANRQAYEEAAALFYAKDRLNFQKVSMRYIVRCLSNLPAGVLTRIQYIVLGRDTNEKILSAFFNLMAQKTSIRILELNYSWPPIPLFGFQPRQQDLVPFGNASMAALRKLSAHKLQQQRLQIRCCFDDVCGRGLGDLRAHFVNKLVDFNQCEAKELQEALSTRGSSELATSCSTCKRFITLAFDIAFRTGYCDEQLRRDGRADWATSCRIYVGEEDRSFKCCGKIAGSVAG